MSLSVQFFSLLSMIGTGIIAAALIDLIGISVAHVGKRSLVKKYSVLLEVFGWILAGIWSFTILYNVRDGAWRIYDPFAQLSGLLLYVSFFHRPFRFVGRVIFLIVLKPIWSIFYFIFSAFKYVMVLLIRLIKIPFSPLVLIFRKLYRKYFKNKVK